MVSVYDMFMCGGWLLLKWVEDVVLFVVIFFVMVIFMLLIGLCIKMILFGFVFFLQDCYGLDGCRIKVFKFWLMYVIENGGEVVQVKCYDK